MIQIPFCDLNAISIPFKGNIIKMSLELCKINEKPGILTIYYVKGADTVLIPGESYKIEDALYKFDYDKEVDLWTVTITQT